MDTITTHVTRSVALALVRLAGLEQDERGRYGGKYWQLDEALTVALVEIADNDIISDFAEDMNAMSAER